MGILGNAAGFGGLSNLPIIGGLLGTGNGQGNTPPSMPTPSMASPGAGPQAWPGFPVPQFNPSAAPQQNFQGDFSKPGAGEGFFAQNQGRWGAPTALGNFWGQQGGNFGKEGPASEYWRGISGKWNAPQKTPGNAQQAWDQFQKSTPANTDAYYDNAIRLGSRDVNRAMAASGLYGGGTGVAPVNEMITNLRAQQAKDNAAYGLNRAQIGGGLASAADQSGLAGLNSQLSWLTGMGNIAGMADQAYLSRLLGGAGVAGNVDATNLNSLNAGMGAALGAQGAQRQRGQDFFGNNLQMGNMLGQSLQNIYMQQLMSDMALTDQQMQAALGYPREAANQSVNNQQRSESGIMNGVSTFGKMLGM